jgi:hypothetical protein
MRRWLSQIRERRDTATLWMAREGTFCLRCDEAADYVERSHLTVPESDSPGCGRRFSCVYVEHGLLSEGAMNRVRCLHHGIPVTVVRSIADPHLPSGKYWEACED